MEDPNTRTLVFPCAPVFKSDTRSAGSLIRRFLLFILPSEAWIAAQVQFCRWGSCNRIVSIWALR